jgi:hypothetical protein
MFIDAESISPVEFEGLLRERLPAVIREHGHHSDSIGYGGDMNDPN